MFCCIIYTISASLNSLLCDRQEEGEPIGVSCVVCRGLHSRIQCAISEEWSERLFKLMLVCFGGILCPIRTLLFTGFSILRLILGSRITYPISEEWSGRLFQLMLVLVVFCVLCFPIWVLVFLLKAELWMRDWKRYLLIDWLVMMYVKLLRLRWVLSSQMYSRQSVCRPSRIICKLNYIFWKDQHQLWPLKSIQLHRLFAFFISSVARFLFELSDWSLLASQL